MTMQHTSRYLENFANDSNGNYWPLMVSILVFIGQWPLSADNDKSM